ncbi:cytochrome P450 [Nocardia farcinica]|uniref:cytochrome P450 n=1 Tax=Nocardia farcinica TaxID=37329 RepID=UPI00189369CB|nr:cytochrome P450 [Nocardia farcinica]MBF6253900.1 cytochrome P450 [Nocardia farcinica]MBF6265439.1 cytochrome P450 [Nocardia farcinica]MBF6271252.1 cytochrome P450 [Nocardia farcinica]MBF6284039.1 cytochrome P450 [Nocardia farcinica]MBF6308071.1 cytochrome P450 [Nocardia farcinica]
MAVTTSTTSGGHSNPPLPHPKWRLPIINDLLTINPIKPTLTSLRDAEQLGGIFERRLVDWPMIVVSDSELITEICDERNWAKHLGVPLRKMRHIARDGLFTARNDEPNWAKAHAVLAPAFTKEAMRSYHQTMLTTIGELLDYWAKRDGQWVDVGEDMNKLTLEIIARTGFDYTFDSFTRSEVHPFVAAMLRGLTYISRNSNMPPFLQKTIGARAAARHSRDITYVRTVVDDVIKARQASGTVGDHHDLLDRMLTVPDPASDELLDTTNVRSQILTMLVAGHETSAGVLAFALYELSRRPELVAAARAEIDTRFADGDLSTIAYDDVAKLRTLRRIVDETLRLYPVAPGFFREARHETTIGGGRYRFGPGDWVLVLTLHAHRDPATWGPDAGEFQPDRWLPERMRSLDGRQVFKPFGTGLRACIGRQFAYHEIVLALAHILHTFEFTPDPGYELDIAEQITLKPHRFRLRLNHR